MANAALVDRGHGVSVYRRGQLGRLPPAAPGEPAVVAGRVRPRVRRLAVANDEQCGGALQITHVATAA